MSPISNERSVRSTSRAGAFFGVLTMSLSLPTLHGIQAGIQYLSVSPDESAATMLHLQELSNAFSQATAAAAAESQPASSKPPSPQVTHPPHPSPAATPTGTGAPLHARPGPGPAQPHSLITQAPQSQAQPQNGTQTPSLAQSRQQLPTQPSQAQPALPSSLPPAGQRAVPASAALSVGQRAFPQSAPAPVQAPALPTPSTGGWSSLLCPWQCTLHSSCNTQLMYVRHILCLPHVSCRSPCVLLIAAAPMSTFAIIKHIVMQPGAADFLRND